MESSTGSTDDSSICGLTGIDIQNQNQRDGIFGRKLDFLEENDSSEEWQGYVDDGDPWLQRSCQARVTRKPSFGRGEGGTGSS